MKLHHTRCLAWLAAFLAAAPTHAQPQNNAPSFQVIDPPQLQVPLTGYPVLGRMTCADTQRAARFAQVTLISANGNGNGGGRRFSARTDLDGNFTIPNVPSGDYYVTGALPGYVNQARQVQTVLNAGTDPAALSGVPLVHVSAGGGSAALSLQRGGTLAGTVQWDDGTPAAGVSVAAQSATASSATSTDPARAFGNFALGGNAGAQTDDRGRFRLSGLAPGSYYLHATVQAPAPVRSDDRGFPRTLSLSVYAPDKIRRTDATPVTIGSGEERPDVNLVIGLAGMHTVSGTVSASAAQVRSGSVNLSDQTDPTLARNVAIASDGSFTIPYVPPGTYTLRITASSQLQSFGRGGGGAGNGGNNESVTRFQPLTESVTVSNTDLTGLSVTVTTATASQ